MSNILDLNKEKKYPKEAELMSKLTLLIDEYSGEISTVAVIGILDMKKQFIVINAR